MRLQTYINEALSEFGARKLKDYIDKNCQPFLKEFGVRYAHMTFIYRGLKTKNVKTYMKLKVHTDRKPRLVDPELHTYLNKIGKEIFGWNIRTEGVFTGGGAVAKSYGEVGIFIPIGKYKYVYVKDAYKIYGLYDQFDYLNDKNEPYYEAEKGKANSILDDIYDVYKNDYKTSGLVNDMNNNQFEAIFKCKDYIMINSTHAVDLVDIMRELLGI